MDGEYSIGRVRRIVKICFFGRLFSVIERSSRIFEISFFCCCCLINLVWNFLLTFEVLLFLNIKVSIKYRFRE